MRSGETTRAPPWAAAGEAGRSATGAATGRSATGAATGRSATGAATSMNAIRSRQARKRAPAEETPMPRLPRTSLLRIAFRSGSLRKIDLAGRGSVTTFGSDMCRIA